MLWVIEGNLPKTGEDVFLVRLNFDLFAVGVKVGNSALPVESAGYVDTEAYPDG